MPVSGENGGFGAIFAFSKPAKSGILEGRR